MGRGDEPEPESALLSGTGRRETDARQRRRRDHHRVAIDVFRHPEYIAYTTGNGGLGAMVRAQAVEWAADTIRVNAIAPGTIVTKLTESLLVNPDALAIRLSKIR